jgi:hypothetical protein
VAVNAPRVLYLVISGAPAPEGLPSLVTLIQESGWRVVVFSTPMGTRFEMAGYKVPVVVVPHCKPQLASHPAFTASLDTLHGMGVQVLFDPAAPYESRLPSWAEVTAALPTAATQGVTR